MLICFNFINLYVSKHWIRINSSFLRMGDNQSNGLDMLGSDKDYIKDQATKSYEYSSALVLSLYLFFLTFLPFLGKFYGTICGGMEPSSKALTSLPMGRMEVPTCQPIFLTNFQSDCTIFLSSNFSSPIGLHLVLPCYFR